MIFAKESGCLQHKEVEESQSISRKEEQKMNQEESSDMQLHEKPPEQTENPA